jgi:uncharacterized protein YecT (DUF1311 family)
MFAGDIRRQRVSRMRGFGRWRWHLDEHAQRAWLSYRDAFVRFAAAMPPNIAGNAVLARLTRLRLAQLEHSDAQ